jgi:ketosteroid isomerase-like protein
MSEENVELVRRGFEAFSDGGLDALMQFAAEDGVWRTAPEFIDAPEYRGHEGLRAKRSVTRSSTAGIEPRAYRRAPPDRTARSHIRR